MIIVRNTKSDKARFLRAAVYGPTGVGKTTWASTFPRPFFFSVGAESGISSLAGLDVDYALIESIRDMDEAVAMFVSDYRKKDWRTAVFDTATIYGRQVSMEISRHGEILLDNAKWNKVLGHLLNARDKIHNCDCHVVWVMHVSERKSGDFVLGLEPKLVGQAQGEVIQTCGLVGYLERWDEPVPAEADAEGKIVKPASVKTVRCYWVRCPLDRNPPFMTKSWYENVLTEPGYAPTFAALAKRLAPRYIQSLIDTKAA